MIRLTDRFLLKLPTETEVKNLRRLNAKVEPSLTYGVSKQKWILAQLKWEAGPRAAQHDAADPES